MGAELHVKRSDPVGFTLVEILIVVVVLGILAAIVVSQFGHTSDEARYSSTKQILGDMRGSIQLYRNQHLGRLPGEAGAFPDTVLIEQMTLPTNGAGERSSAANQGFNDPRFPLGPYMPNRLPPNPFNQSSRVLTVTVFPSAAPGGLTPSDPGWVYEITSGRIKVNWDGKTPAGDLYWDL